MGRNKPHPEPTGSYKSGIAKLSPKARGRLARERFDGAVASMPGATRVEIASTLGVSPATVMNIAKERDIEIPRAPSRPRKTRNEEARSQFRRLAEENPNMSATEIAARLGVSVASVSNFAREYEIGPVPERRGSEAMTTAEIKRALGKIWSSREGATGAHAQDGPTKKKGPRGCAVSHGQRK